MLGLPGATIDDDILMVGETLWLPEFSPDYIKIYPCTLLKKEILQPKLHSLYKSKRWVPPSEEYCQSCMIAFTKAIPGYVRVSRIQRQFSNNEILVGPKRGLRTRLLSKLNDLRAREVGTRRAANFHVELSDLTISLKENGVDQYIEVTQKGDDTLLAIARVTRTSRDSVMLRELKVFGETSPIGSRSQVQGRGLGTRLLLALEYHYHIKNVKNILVNASVGASSFFAKNGYCKTNDKLLMKKLQRTSFNKALEMDWAKPCRFLKGSI